MVKKPRFRTSPEAKIQKDVISFLRLRGWLVKATHGSAFARGWPDLFCWHREYGLKWVDIKVLGRCKLTKAQIQTWPQWQKAGLDVWIMVAATEEEYAKLFQPGNFTQFWKPAYDKYCRPVDDILDEFEQDA